MVGQQINDSASLNLREVQSLVPLGVGAPEIVPINTDNDLDLIKLARFAVDDHNKKYPEDPLEFVGIVCVKVQIVAGFLYYIILEANTAEKESKLFEAQIWVKPREKFCQVQSFVPYPEEKPQPGGIRTIPINSANRLKYIELASFAIDDHNKTANPSDQLEFVKLLGVKQQIVSGVNYWIAFEAKTKKDGTTSKYEAKIFVKQGENIREVESFEPYEETTCFGCLKTISINFENDLKLIGLGRLAVDHYNKEKINADDQLEFVGLVSVKGQVVAGYMYHIVLEASTAKGEGEPLFFKAKIWEKEWETFREVVSFVPLLKDSN